MTELLIQAINQVEDAFHHWADPAGLSHENFTGTQAGDMVLFPGIKPEVVAAFGWSCALGALQDLLDRLTPNPNVIQA